MERRSSPSIDRPRAAPRSAREVPSQATAHRSRPVPRPWVALALCVILGAGFTACGCGGTEGLLDAPRAFSRVGPVQLARVRSRLAGMTEAQKCGQLIMAAAWGRGDLSAEGAAYLRELAPGAVILFGYDIPESAAALRARTDAIRAAALPGDAAAAAELSPLVAIDQEGGAVQRLKKLLGDQPSAARAAALGEAGLVAYGRAVGAQLALLGIAWNLAPVAEAGEGDAAFSRGRYFSPDPARAALLAGAYLRGLQTAVAGAVKHFPAMTEVDPHKALPRLDVDLTGLMSHYVGPFRSILADDGAEALMLSHVLVPVLDPARPASLSPAAIAIARERMDFKGIVLTDDLCMAALAGYGSPSALAVEAVAAGADMVMILDKDQALAARDALLSALASGSLSSARVDEACARILALKLAYTPLPAFDPAALDSLGRALESLLAPLE